MSGKCKKKLQMKLCIVDTGSCDKTVEIASHYTQNIYYFKWIDDFAAARNFSFQRLQKNIFYG